MKIILVRHGGTEYNHTNKIQSKGVSLSDKGRRQCKKLKEQLQDKEIDICFSSPLIRAMETAMILVGDKVLINKDPRLTERSMGELEEHPITEYDHKKYWDYQLNSNELGVEKIQDIFERCNSFINYLQREYQDKSILIVTHEVIIKTIKHIINNDDKNDNLGEYEIPNCYVEQIEI